MLIKSRDDTLMQFREDTDDNFTKMTQLRKKARVHQETEPESSSHDNLSTHSILSIRSVPSDWDYMIMPVRVNLERVAKPQTQLREDYFESAKNMVSITLSLDNV